MCSKEWPGGSESNSTFHTLDTYCNAHKQFSNKDGGLLSTTSRSVFAAVLACAASIDRRKCFLRHTRACTQLPHNGVCSTLEIASPHNGLPWRLWKIRWTCSHMPSPWVVATLLVIANKKKKFYKKFVAPKYLVLSSNSQERLFIFHSNGIICRLPLRTTTTYWLTRYWSNVSSISAPPSHLNECSLLKFLDKSS